MRIRQVTRCVRCRFTLTFARSLLYPFILALCCTNLAVTAMKSLLRKKTLPDSNQKPSLLSSPSPSQQPSSIDTPLYSRFASVIPDAQAPDRNRPVVSGPMPLSRHGRINHEADDRQKKREDTRHKSSNGRQGTPPIPQPPLKSFPGPREVQFSLDRSYQDMRVDTNQAARQPLRTQTTCKSYFPFPNARTRSPCIDVSPQVPCHASRTFEHLSMATISSVTDSPFAVLHILSCGRCIPVSDLVLTTSFLRRATRYPELPSCRSHRERTETPPLLSRIAPVKFLL